MKRILPSLFLSGLGLLCGASLLAAPAKAQRLEIGIDRHGVRVGGEVQLGGPRGPVLRIGGREDCAPEYCHEHVRYELRRVRVWVPGCERVEHVPARWGWRRDACGRMERVLISPAYDRVVQEPGRWEWREERVAVPCRCSEPVCGGRDDDRRWRRSRHDDRDHHDD
jgi:hypothetical protein